MGRGKWWSEDEIVVLMAAGIEVLSLGSADSRKKQDSAKVGDESFSGERDMFIHFGNLKSE